ncbi:Yip1 family protein [Roseomonas sp. CECT 9278]|uniref:Yip1 family protein n=1 Tax=Roseomonas sp. CECT 9278 TaxID=2845823 RepID=UPI001E2863B2|nr:Yip1 family protein [Roseomonas sp. CECT 9278]CAH0291458.1 Inner membrane protein YohC [Roseomonas sp. CECT 9278]
MNHLIERVKGMALSPAQEWRKIAGEPIELVPVFTRYVMILAAIPAIAGFLLLLFFAPVTAFTMAIVGYILSLVGVFVTAKIIEILAPNFGGQPDADAALKLAAFAPTIAWVAGGFIIIPILGGLVALIGGFYALYTLYLGVPIVMRVPQEKALVFTLAVIGVAIVVNIAVRLLTGIFV